MAAANKNTARAQEFFIPNLCTAESVMIMVILAELLVVVHVLGNSALPEFDWSNMALESLFVQWIVLLSAAALCASRHLLGQSGLLLGVLVSFAIILSATLICSLAAIFVISEYSPAEMSGWWLLRNQLIAVVIGGIALRYFYLQQQLREREQAELTARLESLRARIRPHFLFNTMNSIASLISSSPDDAERLVEDLSELFRASLIEEKQDATVADELRLCRLYLEIEHVRLGERLQVQWLIDETLTTQPMPALLLQPLVENAVYHGVARMPEGGTVAISVQQRGDYLEVVVENPLPGGESPVSVGHHMALDNIQQRLTGLYENQAGFVVRQEEHSHRVCLSYPLESAS